MLELVLKNQIASLWRRGSSAAKCSVGVSETFKAPLPTIESKKCTLTSSITRKY